VVFARESGIGIRLAGGNKVGIFICDVQFNSPAERAGLRIADKIVRVNGVDYSNITREEAVEHMLSISLFEMVVGNAPQEYESCAYDSHGGDSFYVRAHFNYANRDDGNELAFQINDILHVTDTLHHGIIGQWCASKLNTKLTGGSSDEAFEAADTRRLTMPNQERAEKLVATAQTVDQVIAAATGSHDDLSGKDGGAPTTTTNGFASLGASARMSIRKRLAGKNSLAKRSRSASRGNGLEVDGE
jgi:tight junction protein 1